MSKYPLILVHGFMGWGEDDKLSKVCRYWGTFGKNVPKYLREQGYEVFVPSLGPFESAWDRSCELYAYIYGGTVDYGKVHSEKYGHERYGRTYPGVLKDLGTGKGHEKVNLVGHSFGGPTVREFSNILANGSKEELDGTPANEVSDFFKGGKAQYVHTVTTLTGCNNGTNLASMFGKYGMNLGLGFLWSLIALVGNTRGMKVYDLYMDQWGLTQDPWSATDFHFTNPLNKMDSIIRYQKNILDNTGREQAIEYTQQLNATMKESDNIYYFARRGARSHEVKFGIHMPDKQACFLAKATGIINGSFWRPMLTKQGFNRREWMPNDGVLNVMSQNSPLNHPAVDYVDGMEIKPGIWHNMPLEYKDHYTWCGLGEDKDTLYKYYLDMVKSFEELK